MKPIKNPKVLSPFGERRRSYHTGIDLRGRKGKGEKVGAARGGTVVFAGRKKGYGKFISVRHRDGFVTRYAHLRKIYVRRGDWVNAGKPIGEVGNSGRSSGPHLHFEILSPKGAFMDPAPFIFR